MSSSKIQSYNLDDSVFDGIAMQSTSEEILGAVGNVAQQKDVQEILEKIEGTSRRGEKFVFATNPTTSPTQTFFSVTGKGKIYYVVGEAYIDANKTSVFTVNVDGKNIYTQTYKNTSSTGYIYVTLSNKDYTAGNSLHFNGSSINKKVSSSADAYTTMDTIDENSEITRTQPTDNYLDGVMVNGYIQFNESATISCTNMFAQANIAQVYICYSLDED